MAKFFNFVNKNFSTAQTIFTPEERRIKPGIYYSAPTARRTKYEAAYRHPSCGLKILSFAGCTAGRPQHQLRI